MRVLGRACRGACLPSKRLPEEPWRITDAERRPASEDVEVGRAKLLENPDAAQPGEPELPAQTSADAVAHRTPLVEQRPRPAADLSQREGPGSGHSAGLEIRFPRPEAFPIRQRHVHAPLPPVACKILPEI